MRRRRAFSLALVLALLVLAAAGILQLVSLIGSQREAFRLVEFQDRAVRYASNALELAVAKLETNPEFQDDLIFPAQPGDRSDASGLVTFKTSAPYHSTNNFAQNDPATLKVGQFQRQIPPHTVHLLSQGSYGRKTVYVEAFVAVPLYDYAIACKGSLATDGPFLVGALADPSAWQGDARSPQFLAQLRRASMVANSTGSPAILLSGSPVRVTGNLVSPGKISAGGAQVDGQIEEGHRPLGLPEISFSELDPVGKPLLRTLDAEVSGEVAGFARRSGDLSVNGDLVLKEAVLFVDGDFTCSGSLSGLGAIVVTGRTNLRSVSLKSLQQLALVSKGDLTVSGQGQTSSTLLGLLYTQGNLSLSDVTVVGAVVAGGSRMQLHNVNVLQNPKGVAFEFAQSWVGGTQSAPMPSGLPGSPNVVVRLKDPSKKPADFAPPNRFDPNSELVAVYVGGSQDGQEAGAVSSYTGRPNSLASRFLSQIQQQIPKETQDPKAVISAGKVDMNLNRFLKLADKLKVVYRRTYYGIPSEPTGTS
jgi:hypothetical protein